MNNLQTCCAPVKNDKEIVLKGVLPTSKASLIAFLKGMGLSPKVEVKGGEIIITADMSQLVNENVKRKFLRLMQKQMLETEVVSRTDSRMSQTDNSLPFAKEACKVDREAYLSLSKINALSKISSEQEPTSNETPGINTIEQKEEIVVRPEKLMTDISNVNTEPINENLNEPAQNQSPAEKSDIKKLAKRRKKLRLMKKIRRLFKSKKSLGSHPQTDTVVNNLEIDTTIKRTQSNNSCKEPKLKEVRFNKITINKCSSSTIIATKKDISYKSLRSNDGSYSMPALVRSSNSQLKITQFPNLIAKKCDEKSGERKVVSKKDDIRVKKNRLFLEGKSTKYASILHKDKSFHKHVRDLKNSNFQNIERDVNNVKERIMFARAMNELQHKLPKDAPTVSMNKLLWSSNSRDMTKQMRERIDVVAKSSFYQKFVASMNILKCTKKLDSCDRSIMTDDPLSKTYADFIAALVAMEKRNSKRSNKKCYFKYHNKKSSAAYDTSEYLSDGDSSCRLTSGGYFGKFWRCWDHIFIGYKRDDDSGKTCSQKPQKKDEIRILGSIFDKALEIFCTGSRNKGYIKTEIPH